jgi:hypothetical protein
MSKDSLLENQQLKVQELCLRFADTSLYSAAGPVVTVNLQEPLEAIVYVEHMVNAGPTDMLIAAASSVITANSVAITLAVPFAANDVLVIKYIVA